MIIPRLCEVKIKCPQSNLAHSNDLPFTRRTETGCNKKSYNKRKLSGNEIVPNKGAHHRREREGELPRVWCVRFIRVQQSIDSPDVELHDKCFEIIMSTLRKVKNNT